MSKRDVLERVEGALWGVWDSPDSDELTEGEADAIYDAAMALHKRIVEQYEADWANWQEAATAGA